MERIPINDLQIGDILGLPLDKWPGPWVRFWLKLQARIFYKKKIFQAYNHSAVIIQEETPFKVAEAIGKGFVIRNLFSTYSIDYLVHEAVVFRPVEPFNEEQKLFIQDMARIFAEKNIEYEFLNFFWWMVYILTNRDVYLGPRIFKKENKLFCHEVGGILWNKAREGFFIDPYVVSTVDMQFNPKIKMYKLRYGDK